MNGWSIMMTVFQGLAGVCMVGNSGQKLKKEYDRRNAMKKRQLEIEQKDDYEDEEDYCPKQYR